MREPPRRKRCAVLKIKSQIRGGSLTNGSPPIRETRTSFPCLNVTCLISWHQAAPRLAYSSHYLQAALRATSRDENWVDMVWTRLLKAEGAMGRKVWPSSSRCELGRNASHRSTMTQGIGFNFVETNDARSHTHVVRRHRIGFFRISSMAKMIWGDPPGSDECSRTFDPRNKGLYTHSRRVTRHILFPREVTQW